jgi:hypothetical protein
MCMTKFMELPPGLAELLIEDAEDDIGPAMEERMHRMSTVPCSRCGGAMRSKVFASAPFSPESPLPRMSAECKDCGFEQMMDSGIVVNNGNLAKVEEVLPLVGKNED